MSTNMAVREGLDEILAISKVLGEKIKGGDTKITGGQQLIDISDDIIIAWSKEDGCLLSQLLHPPDSKVQTLTLSNPPMWDVHQIVLNRSGTGLALIGTRGVAVVELPRRWGDPPLFEGGRDTVICRVEYIAERFFSCHPKLEVIHALWHPGAPDHNHLVLLTSDNYLRIYSVSSPEIPEQAVSVGSARSNVLNCSSSTLQGATLGEVAVCMSVAPPIKEDKHQSGNPISNGCTNGFIDPDDEEKQQHLDLLWPIFILYGNGDVYYTITSLSPARRHKRGVMGPLSVHPPCSDNYGIDSCSLVALQSSPPVLVIANTSGNIRHCIVVTKEMDEDGEQHTVENSFSQLSLASCSVSLHVYEAFELELSLLPDNDAYTSPLTLHRDPTSPIRYFASHDAGVHSVSVPLVDHLLQYSELPDNALFSSGVSEESSCSVEHLVCTRSLASAPGQPVVGLAASLSPAALYTQLHAGHILKLSLPPAYLPPCISQHPEYHDVEEFESPLRKAHSEAFEERIRGVLRRSCTQPILASGWSGTVSAGEYLSLLDRSMATLNTAYIHPQRLAQQDIDKRSSILIEQKQRLETDIEELKNEKKQLTDKAHDLAEKYEEANDKQTQLLQRLEVVVRQGMRGLPTLTSGEKMMLKELEEMQSQMATFTNQLHQINTKETFQVKQMEKASSLKPTSVIRPTTSISDSQLKSLKSALSKESGQLTILLQKVNHMKKDLQL